MSSDSSTPKQRLRALLKRRPILILGSEVTCHLIQHRTARIAHPLGLLDRVCELAGEHSRDPSAWLQRRDQLAEPNPDLAKLSREICEALPTLADLPRLFQTIQGEIAALRVRDSQATTYWGWQPARILDTSYVNIYSESDRRVFHIGYSPPEALPPQIEAWLEWLKKVTGVVSLDTETWHLRLPAWNPNSEVILVGFGEPIDPILEGLIVYLKGVVGVGNVYVSCTETSRIVLENNLTMRGSVSSAKLLSYKPCAYNAISFSAYGDSELISHTEVRRMIYDAFPNPPDFEKFIIDKFPNVCDKLEMNKEREVQISALFRNVEPNLVAKKLMSYRNDAEDNPDGNCRIESYRQLICETVRLPAGLAIYEKAKELLLNRYSLVLADGQGPGEQLLRSPAEPSAFIANKSYHLHWEGNQFKTNRSKRDLELLRNSDREEYAKSLLPNAEPNSAFVANIAKATNDQLLYLLIRLLAPGVHVSFQLMPILESMIIKERRNSIVHSVLPRIGNGKQRRKPGATIRTYFPHRPTQDQYIDFNGITEFVDSISRDRNDEYIIIRPYGGYVLQRSLYRGHWIDSLSGDGVKIYCTDDFHRKIFEPGVFGRKNDQDLLDCLVDGRRHVVYAKFAMEHRATRDILHWVRQNRGAMPDDMVMTADGLYYYAHDGGVPEMILERLNQQSIDKLCSALSDARIAQGAGWWKQD